MSDRVTVLGVPLDPVTSTEALARLHAILASPGLHHVMTPNNEMLVEASRNPQFHELLNRTSLNLADSTGLLWAARHTGQHLPQRVTGVDTVEALCNELTSQEPVFFLGAGEGIALKAAQRLRMKNKGLVIAGAYAGSPRNEDAKDIIAKINESGARLLLVAYGAPSQDLWIDTHKHELKHVRLAMGVGGTFDFIAGAQKRAPTWMRGMGLEWLWRLVQQPSRWKRIVNATIVFPMLVLLKNKR